MFSELTGTLSGTGEQISGVSSEDRDGAAVEKIPTDPELVHGRMCPGK